MPSSKPAWSRHPVQSEAARGERQRVRRDKGWGGVLATLWLPWLEKRGGGDVSIQGGSEISPKSLGSQGVTEVSR